MIFSLQLFHKLSEISDACQNERQGGEQIHFVAGQPAKWSTGISFYFTVVESNIREYDQGHAASLINVISFLQCKKEKKLSAQYNISLEKVLPHI